MDDNITKFVRGFEAVKRMFEIATKHDEVPNMISQVITRIQINKENGTYDAYDKGAQCLIDFLEGERYRVQMERYRVQILKKNNKRR